MDHKHYQLCLITSLTTSQLFYIGRHVSFFSSLPLPLLSSQLNPAVGCQPAFELLKKKKPQKNRGTQLSWKIPKSYLNQHKLKFGVVAYVIRTQFHDLTCRQKNTNASKSNKKLTLLSIQHVTSEITSDHNLPRCLFSINICSNMVRLF